MKLFFNIKMSCPFGHYCSCCFVFTGDEGTHPELPAFVQFSCVFVSVSVSGHPPKLS